VSDHTHAEPTAQGRAPGASRGQRAGFLNYVVGLGFAIVLTLASFWAAGTPLVWGPGVPVLLAALAIGQMGVHLVFFLHITTGPDNTNNVLALAFGLLVVFLVVGGTVWIMAHLNQNMPPMDQIMPMRK